jgi:hypothetical protein
MLKVAKDFNPDEIVLLGDFLDFYSVSSHQKDPSLPHMLEKEIDQGNMYLDELDHFFPGKKKVYLEGNHEFRLARYLQNNAPALFGMVSTKHLLDLNRRPNWKWVSYSPNQKYKVGGSKLLARHEPIGSSAKTTSARGICSIAYGHVHKIEEAYIVGMDNKQHVSFSCGWLGDTRFSSAFNYVKNHHNWQLGFTLVYTDPKTKKFYHQKIPILPDLTCLFNGKVYKG